MSSPSIGTAPTRADRTAATALAAFFIAGCGVLAVIVAAGAGNCSAPFAIPGFCQSSPGLAIAAAIAALPLIILLLVRRSLAAFLALYIVLVPIDDALLVGSGLTITKMVGIAVALAAIGRLIKRRAQIRLPLAVFGWIAVVGLMALSVLWAVDPSSSTGELVTICSALALMLILVAVPMDRAELRAIIAATIVSGAVVGIVALVLARHEVSTIQGQVGRLYLTFGSATLDPNRFGAALLLPVAMTVGALGQAAGWRRIGLFALLGLTFTAIYLSASRGTLLALIAMAIVGILTSRYRVALGALLASSVGLLLVVPSEISKRLFLEGTAANGAGRLDIWRVAVEIFRGHWLLGTGAGTFIPAYNRAFFLAYEPQFAGWNRDPHSLLLSTATELGMVGIAIMAVALVLQYRTVRLVGADDSYRWLRTVFRAAFIGLLVAALFVDVLTTKFAWLLFTEMLIFSRVAVESASPTRAESLGVT